jgi:hypothetical protein
MEMLKQEVATAILKLPNTANIDDIQSALDKIRHSIDTAATETQAISCYDLAKDYIGCMEGPEDLSTNKAYFKGFGL